MQIYIFCNNIKVIIGCNTSADQYLTLNSNSQVLPPVNEIDIFNFEIPAVDNNPLNITTVLWLWSQAVVLVDLTLFPLNKRSILFPSLVANNLSYLELGYYCYFESEYFVRSPLLYTCLTLSI